MIKCNLYYLMEDEESSDVNDIFKKTIDLPSTPQIGGHIYCTVTNLTARGKVTSVLMTEGSGEVDVYIREVDKKMNFDVNKNAFLSDSNWTHTFNNHRR